MLLVLAALSLGAAAIHLAAGPAHVEALGDLGLGFYGAALFQVGLAIGLLRAGALAPGRWIRRVGLAGTAAISSAWLVSRTVGLPLVPGGVEPVGTADLIATILQLGIIVGLVGWTPRRAAVMRRTLPRPSRFVASGALIGVLAVIAVSSSIAVADAVAGHGHAPGVGAEHVDDGHARADDETSETGLEADRRAEPSPSGGHAEASPLDVHPEPSPPTGHTEEPTDGADVATDHGHASPHP